MPLPTKIHGCLVYQKAIYTSGFYTSPAVGHFAHKSCIAYSLAVKNRNLLIIFKSRVFSLENRQET